MVKNGEICQFLNQIHHSPFFTISKMNFFKVPELSLKNGEICQFLDQIHHNKNTRTVGAGDYLDPRCRA